MEKRRERSIEEGDSWLMMPLDVVDPSSFAFQFSRAPVFLLPPSLLLKNKLLFIGFLLLVFSPYPHTSNSYINGKRTTSIKVGVIKKVENSDVQ